MADQEKQGAAAAPGSRRTITPAYANYVLGMLFVLYIFNFIDRQILAILLQPIKVELGLSDTALGLLTGIVFAAIYSFAGIPIARLADRRSRVTIITVGLALWSGMTAASGLALNFGQLALARFGVGIGEATFVPSAHSLISDYFPPERRATAMAVFSMGIYVGVALGFLLGGWIAQQFGWRYAFFVVGLPGLAMAVLLRVTVREPPRGHSEQVEDVEDAASFGEAARFIWRLRTYRHLALGSAIHSFGGYAFAGWGPTFYRRVFDMTIGEVGLWLGIILGTAGAAGALLGGTLADRLGARDMRWQGWVPAIASASAIPFVILILHSPSKVSSLLFLIPNSILGAMWFGPVFATTQGLVKHRMRAVASAVQVLIVNLIGLGLGPLAVGYLNDRLAPRFEADTMRYSLLIIVVANLWAATHFLLAARTVREDLKVKDQ